MRSGIDAGGMVLMRAGGRIEQRLAGPAHVLPQAGARASFTYATSLAGVGGADRIEWSFVVSASARLVMSEASPTFLLPSKVEGTVRLDVEVGERGECVVVEWPLVALGGSRSSLRRSIRTEGSARLLHVEGLTSGRIGRGDRWCHSRTRGISSLYRDGELVFEDRTVTGPDTLSPPGTYTTALLVTDVADQLMSVLSPLLQPLPGCGFARLDSMTILVRAFTPDQRHGRALVAALLEAWALQEPASPTLH